MLTFSIIIAFLSLIPFIYAFSANNLSKNTITLLSLSGISLGIIHGVIMIELFGLSYLSINTFVKCAPYIALYAALFLFTSKAHFIKKLEGEIIN